MIWIVPLLVSNEVGVCLVKLHYKDWHPGAGHQILFKIQGWG